MCCMDCARAGKKSDAAALCHSCSAALCLDHALVIPRRLDRMVHVLKSKDLPIQARMILCETCKAALDQRHLSLTA